MVDQASQLVEGQVLDLCHGQPFFPPADIYVGNQNDYADAELIVVTTGDRQRSGETRLDLLRRNAQIVEDIVSQISRQESQAVVLIVTNPVDGLTYVAAKVSNWDRSRIFGSGTVLDTARLRHLLGQQLHVDVHNIHAYVLGEFGQQHRQDIEKAVRNSAYHIIDYKGSTHFGVASALVRIAGAVLRAERNILTVSTVLHGEYGISDVCLSVPCIVSDRGVEQIVEVNLPSEERESLLRSARVIRDAIGELEPD